jgi:DNA polymerase-3 subunit beta
MQLVVSRKDLVRILQRCQGVADKKSTMPVLGNVLLEVEGPDRLRVAATDLYVAITGAIPAEVEKGGSIALGARDLLERIKAMPEGKISIETNAAATTIRAVGHARRYTLHGLPGEEFPALPQAASSAERLSLSASALARLMAGTHFSISTDETRLHLSSALFEWDGDKVRMVTTDGHRLSKMDVRLPSTQTGSSMLVPLKGITELRRLCDEVRGEGDDLDIGIVQSGSNVFFDMKAFQFSVKLVDAQFPPYQQVIPASSERRVVASRLAVIESLRAVQVAASDRTGGVKVTLSKNVLRFSSENPDSGEGFDEVSAEYSGGELTVGFNAKYLLDVLGAIDSDHIAIELSGELDPAVIAPAKQPENATYTAVIMPMRI